MTHSEPSPEPPLLSLRSNLRHLLQTAQDRLPFYVYTVGTEKQAAITRIKGFSASQLLVTFAGTGIFRTLEQDKWDIVEPGSLLFIPAQLPHEYVPQGSEPWLVGYVTFVESHEGMLARWGFGQTPYRFRLTDTGELLTLLTDIWTHSGPGYDGWRSAGQLFAFCMEVKKQASASIPAAAEEDAYKPPRFRDSVVDNAVRFLHDYLHRELTLTELAAHIGYSPKHLNRLFWRERGVTPMQYLQHIRLKTAALLLAEQPGLTVRQVAAHIGMEPDYMARLFRRVYGLTPTAWRERRHGAVSKG